MEPAAAKVEGPALPFLEGLPLRSLRGLAIPSLRGALQPPWLVAAAFVLVFGTLLLCNLGHDYLWDDEANTALFGESVWRTGHPSAVVGHNIVAFREGLELQGLENRRIPPLPYYVEAPFIGLLGPSPLAARLPFALVGLLGLLLVLYWLRTDNAELRTWILVGLGACGNVSLILYTRQARYYALAAFLTLLVTYIYLHRNDTRRTLAVLSIGALALLTTSYLAYAALVASLAVDYLVFGRHRKAFTQRELLYLIGTQAVVGGLVLLIWNPLDKPPTGYQPVNWIGDKLTLLFWSVRDLDSAEFGVSLLLVAAPILYLLTRRRNVWLVRLPLVLVVYGVTVTVFSPQPVGVTRLADIRYLQPAIPAFIFLGVATLESLPRLRAWHSYLAAVVLFCTNLLNIGTATVLGGPAGPPRSTLSAYVGELLHPLPSPYAAASDWIDLNVAPEQSVFVLPEYATYPLMFHARQAVYAWQLPPSLRPQYPTLPPIHFKGAAIPDYIIVFGYNIAPGRSLVDSLASQGVQYIPYAYLPVHWPDPARPELFLHSFAPVPLGDPSWDGVFIFRRA